jgi:acyl-CoA synthetase
LSKYDMPEFFIEMESFPLTASGKVLKRQLVAMVAQGLIEPQPVRWQG